MRWADADKSDDFVKQKLKLNGLSGDALKSNKNYKYFKQFVDIKEGNQRDVWLKQEVSTSDVWTKLGFGNVKTQEELTKASLTTVQSRNHTIRRKLCLSLVLTPHGPRKKREWKVG
ncbi:RxLR effector protein [Phytophthora megakarya]|uniref:RxLR effector protein n=1 Tax=Phytophthora megakarya TaxID=4795 RepID=A0A225VKI2_9STRA|nr:RxLR effector protein [Phytophthora megakarya]